MKPLVVAIERDRDQAARLDAIVRTRAGADLVLAGSTAEALTALGDRVPDLILTPPLLPARDEAAVADRLRQLGPLAAHVQTITVPRLGADRPTAARKERGLFKRLRRAEAPAEHASACDPEVFAQQLLEYLQRAQTERTAAAEALAAANREAQHRTAEITVAPAVPDVAAAFVAPAPWDAFDAGNAADAAVDIAPAPADDLYAAVPAEVAAYDPLLELLVPERTTERPATPRAFDVASPALPVFETIEEVLGFEPSLLVSDPIDAGEQRADAQPAAEQSAGEAVVAEVRAAEPPVAVAAAAYEAEPVAPAFPALAIQAAEPLMPVAAVAYEQEPIAPVFPHVEQRQVEAAEPVMAVAAIAYEPEPVAPPFPALDPPVVEDVRVADVDLTDGMTDGETDGATDGATAVTAAATFAAVDTTAFDAVVATPPGPAGIDEDALTGIDAFEPEALADGAEAAEFGAFPMLVAPDEDIASAIAAAAAVTDAFFEQDPIADAAVVDAAVVDAAAVDAAAMDTAVGDAAVVDAGVVDAGLLEARPLEAPQPAVVEPVMEAAATFDLSDLELEFLLNDEPKTVVEPVPPAADAEAELPFVIATTDYDDLEISEFLEALVTAQPQPEKKKPARPKAQAAAGKTKSEPAPADARTDTRTDAARPQPARRAAKKRPAPAPTPAPAPRPAAPVQDEWGVFDPDQCGFAALVAKLDEITDDEAPPKRPGSSTRVVSYG